MRLQVSARDMREVETGVEEEFSFGVVDQHAIYREAARAGQAGVQEHVGSIQGHGAAIEQIDFRGSHAFNLARLGAALPATLPARRFGSLAIKLTIYHFMAQVKRRKVRRRPVESPPRKATPCQLATRFSVVFPACHPSSDARSARQWSRPQLERTRSQSSTARCRTADGRPEFPGTSGRPPVAR